MSTTIRVRPAPGRSVDATDFADITAAAATVAWADAGFLEVTFDADLDAATVRAVRIRIRADNPRQEDLMLAVAAAMAQTPTTAAERVARLEAALAPLVRLWFGDDS